MTASSKTLGDLASQPVPSDVVGGKVANLAKLVVAGLRVPFGYVLVGNESLPEHVDDLDWPVIVRSSSTIEDSETGGAPGLFESIQHVQPHDLAAAVRRVRASLSAPAARAYLDSRGISPGSVSMAVLVQSQVSGQRARGTIATRRPGEPDAASMEVEAVDDGLVRSARVYRDGCVPHDADPAFPLTGSQLQSLAKDALRAEKALGSKQGVDVEWVLGESGLWIVQGRPLLHGRSRRLEPRKRIFAFSRQEPDVVWRWDVTHNPDPLTPAQIALVDRVQDKAPYRMRVVEGYLYTAARGDHTPDSRPIDKQELLAIWDRVTKQIDAALATVENSQPSDLQEALTAYEQVFALYMNTLGPALERAHRSLPAGIAPDVGSPLSISSPHAHAIASAWDVAAPTNLESGRGSKQTSRTPSDVSRRQHPRPTNLRTLVQEIAEADDELFFRAQTAVRRALLALSAKWGLHSADDIFYFPFVAAARAQRERRRQLAMPLAFANGRPLPAAGRRSGDVWRGRGGGGVAQGNVVIVGDLGQLPTAKGADLQDVVIVGRALTPGMIAQLAGVAAIVVEFGEFLGHVAAMARELRIPYVVGCVGATEALLPGDHVFVDGDAGIIVKLHR